MPEINFGPN